MDLGTRQTLIAKATEKTLVPMYRQAMEHSSDTKGLFQEFAQANKLHNTWILL